MGLGDELSCVDTRVKISVLHFRHWRHKDKDSFGKHSLGVRSQLEISKTMQSETTFNTNSREYFDMSYGNIRN